MEFETIDSARGQLPGDDRAHFQGQASMQVTEPGDIDRVVDEGDWAEGY